MCSTNDITNPAKPSAVASHRDNLTPLIYARMSGLQWTFCEDGGQLRVEPAKHEHLEALAKIAAGEALLGLEIQVTFSSGSAMRAS